MINFTLILTLQKGPGTTYSMMWNTWGSKFTQSHTANSTTITYIWTLASGQTVSTVNCPMTFTAQIGGSGTVKSTGNDTYIATATMNTTQTNTLTGVI